MDFEDTQEEAAYRRSAREWLQSVTVPSRAAPTPPDGASARLQAAREFQRKKADRGFAAILLPREYGGGGGTPIQQVIYLQEEANFHTFDAAEIFGVGLAMCLPSVLQHGDAAQRERYIRPAIRGEEIWCQVFSEPGGGSDVAAARTTAVRDGDGWRINGQKTWTSCAHFADFGLITTRTDAAVPKHDGLTTFILDMHAPGVEVRPIRQFSGETDFNEVFLTDVQVPDSQRIGAVGGGWRVIVSTLMHERAGIGARSRDLGWQDLLALARGAELDGRPALEDDRVGERIVDAWLTEFGCRLLAMRSQTALSKGETPGPEQSVLKMLKAPLLQQNAYLAMDLYGAAGALTHETLGADWSAVERGWSFGAAIRIAGGTDEILHNIVAERVLGLPPDIRLDKGVPFDSVPR